MALRRLGLAGEELERACAAVAASVGATLATERGRWVLRSDHPQAVSEWALTAVDEEGRIADLIIDRSFICAQSGERWIVDYKNSAPEQGESKPAFFSREAERYLPQLRRYRDALLQLEDRTVRCALFFTALGHFYPLDELALPVQEG